MWIESHQELGSHPKTKRLARALGISRPAAVGHLHYLWWWTLDYGDNGSLAKYTAEDIADAMLYDGDPDKLVDALLACGVGGAGGFLDRDDLGNLSIHHWEEYVGRLEHAREQNRKKQQRWRDRHKTGHVTPETEDNNRYVTGYATEDNPATVPNLTIPNRTKPNQTKQDHVSGADAPGRRAPATSARPKRAKQNPADGKRAHPHLEQERALANVLGIPIGEDGTPDTSALTPPEQRTFYASAAFMGKAHRTDEDIQQAGEAHRRKWPGFTVTGPSLCQHITELLGDGLARAPANGHPPEGELTCLENGDIVDAHGRVVGRDRYARAN